MSKILFFIGTRPEAIKMAPVIIKFKNEVNKIQVRVCTTGQHREMLDQVLNFFGIEVDYKLDVMTENQTLFSLTSTLIDKMEAPLEKFSPNYVFVHGDTSTTFVGALAAFYFQVKICHIEAGLRTYNLKSPFPEEMNRQVVSKLTDIHFCPTEAAKDNLLSEGVDKEKIHVTGNTVVDALLMAQSIVVSDHQFSNPIITKLKSDASDLLLVTAHRRENHGEGINNICDALIEISKKFVNLLIVYPVHLNPNIHDPVKKLLGGIKNIFLVDPLSYPDFVWMMARSKVILTDSGGVQEEAPSLGKPVLVTRDTTERPEAISAGTVKLVGTDKEKIFEETVKLLEDESYYNSMSKAINPYGDGKASQRILKIVEYNC